jgi:aminopeptidase-like protein
MLDSASLHPGNIPEIGREAYETIRELYPISRSITGDGVRTTLRAVQRHIPLEIVEVPSGTQVFDWTVPPEWNIKDAYVKNRQGERIVDFRNCNLHVVGYSVPVHAKLTLNELKPHLFTIPERPDWIPFRTTFYHRNWGFCLSHKQFSELTEDEYEILIDSTLTESGTLTYGECYLPGRTKDEVLVSTHVCHPSLCNDNLSGISIATLLARTMATWDRQYSYRFLFIPTTIGSITWLATHEDIVPFVKHGVVLTGLGDRGKVTYKKSREGKAVIDRVMAHVLKHSGQDHRIIDFMPYGYDERQFCSPGFNLPVGSFMRTPHGEYPEYHTSGDNLDLVSPVSLGASYEHCLNAFSVLEHNRTYRTLNPKCEPQLGKRGLYRKIAGQQDKQIRELALLWVLNLSDGTHSLLDIAERSGMPFPEIRQSAESLAACGLIKDMCTLGHS